MMEIIQSKGFRHRTGPELSYRGLNDAQVRGWLIRIIERFGGQKRLQQIYDEYTAIERTPADFWDDSIKLLNLRIIYNHENLEKVPRSGPLVIIANHPFGILDGIAAGHIVSKVRRDFKFLAHASLERAEPFKPYLIPINFDQNINAVRKNIESKKNTLAHLEDGGAIIIFPAGEVSTATKLSGKALDNEWKPFVGKLIMKARSPVLPLFFDGQNSWLFHFVSKFSSTIREAVLLRELYLRIGTEVECQIGDSIPFHDLAQHRDRSGLLKFLRQTVYGLEKNTGSK